MRYFKNVNTLEELRKEYRRLLKQYHPDQPEGSEEATKEINSEYEKLFDTLKNSDTKENAWKYDRANDELFKEALQAIINLNITIEIIGSWIWCSGDTFPVKDILKTNGFSWCSKKKAWSWHDDGYKKKSRKELTLEEIRNYYGSETVKTGCVQTLISA